MGQLGYLFAANVCVWVGILVYVVSLMKRNQTLRRDLDLLKETLEKDSEK